MKLDLTDEETAALARLLRNTIDADRYPLSPRVRTWQAILDKIEPPPPGPHSEKPQQIRAGLERLYGDAPPGASAPGGPAGATSAVDGSRIEKGPKNALKSAVRVRFPVCQFPAEPLGFAHSRQR